MKYVAEDTGTTVPLQTAAILSALIFLINYTFEVLVLHDLYRSQHFLIALLQWVFSLWAIIEVWLLDRRRTPIPLGKLSSALIVQLVVGIVRHLPDFSVIDPGLAKGWGTEGLELGIVMVFVPIHFALFLIISKLLITAFSHAEHVRTSQLEEQVSLTEQAVQALRLSEERYRLIADRTDDVIWTINPSGRFTYVSPSVERLRGYSPEEVMRQSFSEALLPSSFKRIEPVYLAALADAGDGRLIKPFRGELEQSCKDGSSVWTEIIANGLYSADGHFAGFVGVTRDIGERRRQEQILHEAHAAAEAANQAKTEFLNNVSHEIRTPMNAIIGLSQVLLESRLDTQQANGLYTIHRSAQALLRLINDILDLAKIEARQLSLSPDCFVPAELLDEVVDLFRISLADKGLRLDIDIAENVPAAIRADDLRLRQVLVNLIGNAVKFTEHGHIAISVLPATPVGDAFDLAVTVSDTGIGIAPEQLGKICQPFVQVDTSISRRYGGTGLGLAISSQLVKLMGGSLTVESEVGRGTRFSFTIRVEPCLGAPSGRGGAAASSPTQSMPLPTEPANPIPAGSIRPRLDRLEEQLASNMLDAQQLAHDIEATLAASGHGSAFAPIMEAIQQLRFREARAALAKFRSSLSA